MNEWMNEWTVSIDFVRICICLAISWLKFLTEPCNCIASSAIPIRCCLSSSVVCLFITRVYCDKTAEAVIMQFSLKCSPMPQLFACQVWLRNSKGVSLISGFNLGWGDFWLRDTISRKRCEIELRWLLIITNRKSYMGFRLQQKLVTLNDLERQFTALSSICVFWPNGWG